MRVVILGSGRMGLRHADGVCRVKGVSNLCMVDKVTEALHNAKEQLSKYSAKVRMEFKLLEEFEKDQTGQFDIGILASTAQSRMKDCEVLVEKGVKEMLIEKPLGQSYKEVKDLISFFEGHRLVKAYVNLNMRLFEYFKQVRKDLITLPQFDGPKTITVNMGAVGIGANGIHYLDLLYFLLDASDAEIIHGEIDEQLIPSGRGSQFSDFGGLATIKFTRDEIEVGIALISLSSRSTVFGGWDIVGSHGRIVVDESLGRRTDIIRKKESSMPINRYAADYLPPVDSKIQVPALSDLTGHWVASVMQGSALLPTIGESDKVHRLMFDWLSMSRRGNNFPIT